MASNYTKPIIVRMREKHSLRIVDVDRGSTGAGRSLYARLI